MSHDLRRFINLIEGAAPAKSLNEITEPLPDETMSEAFDLLYEYVTHGEVRTPSDEEYFEESFTRLMELLPRPAKSIHVARALRLADEQIAQWQSGHLFLKPRRFMSWTKSADAAERLAWSRGRTGHPVIVSYEAPPSLVVVDVKQFYETYGVKDDSYFNYVRKELEVIVRHDQPLMLTRENTVLLERAQIVPPSVGDFVYDGDDENPFEIVSVSDYQPDAEAGIFQVTTRYYHELDVRPIMVNGQQAEGEWETVD
jgi:hypothetical protein